MSAHTVRLDQIEAMLGNPSRYVSTAQVSRLSQAVKAIGLELGKRSGRNEFGGVNGELYRRFDIASYRELPANKYDEAMNFLTQWYSSLVDNDLLPF
ncbi:MAG: ORF6C domain-containing protein [Anaerolineae bacterium]|nr:ORF6C domain-containing protein [Anaerolineae bacterium]MCO5193091.1 ORF6C domain-containing protein [Anaerolineae bacterium]